MIVISHGTLLEVIKVDKKCQKDVLLLHRAAAEGTGCHREQDHEQDASYDQIRGEVQQIIIGQHLKRNRNNIEGEKMNLKLCYYNGGHLRIYKVLYL